MHPWMSALLAGVILSTGFVAMGMAATPPVIKVLTFKDDKGSIYDVPENELGEFQKVVPNAIPTTQYKSPDGKTYSVPEADTKRFLQQVPDAVPAIRIKMADGSEFCVLVSEVDEFLKFYQNDPSMEKERVAQQFLENEKAGIKTYFAYLEQKFGLLKAQYRLGNMYYYGHGVEKNLVEAVRWFRKAAEYDRAQYMLGLSYANGNGVEKNLVAAARWYRKAAEQGYSMAQYSLGALLYSGGEGVAKDFRQAVSWFRKAAKQGNSTGNYMLGCSYENGNGVETNLVEAAAWYRKAAEQGYSMAQYRLGNMYYYGHGVNKDTAEGARWYRKAADQGMAVAQYMLGYYYDSGDRVNKDTAEAARWYRKAAEQGSAGAQYNLGLCYKNGDGVEKNSVEAAAWFRKAAEQGIAEAQFSLGGSYEYGKGVEKNLVEAVSWYRKAAEQGYVMAQYFLGSSYSKGEGIAKDFRQAAHWYRKAADQGNAMAQNALGICYEQTEEGVNKDTAEATRLYRKSADQGNAMGNYLLGHSYEYGKGVLQSDIQACIHYLIANALGFASTGFKTNMRGRLSDVQYGEAQRLASEWMDDLRTRQEKGAPQRDRPIAIRQTAKLLGTGSGVVITSDGYFLTCAHVIKNAREIKVRFGDKTHAAKLVRSDARNDVALLKLEGDDFRPLALSQSIPCMGDKVFTIGFPNPSMQGAASKYTDGSISALSGILDDIRTMQITIPVQGGNSGGALADASGNVIGLVMAQLNAVTVFEYTGTIPQNVNFAVKINYALPLIQAVPGLSRRLPKAKTNKSGTLPIDTVEAATGMVLVY